MSYTPVNDYHTVPSADSSDNTTMSDVIGNKTDTHDGDSVRAILHTADEHIHKPAHNYPTLANGITVTSSASSWTLGNAATIVPASTITEDFDIHYVSVENISDNDVYELFLYDDGVEVAHTRFVKNAISDATVNVPVQTPIIAANSTITAKLACAGGTSHTVDISIFYHEY